MQRPHIRAVPLRPAEKHRHGVLQWCGADGRAPVPVVSGTGRLRTLVLGALASPSRVGAAHAVTRLRWPAVAISAARAGLPCRSGCRSIALASLVRCSALGLFVRYARFQPGPEKVCQDLGLNRIDQNRSFFPLPRPKSNRSFFPFEDQNRTEAGSCYLLASAPR